MLTCFTNRTSSENQLNLEIIYLENFWPGKENGATYVDFDFDCRLNVISFIAAIFSQW